MKKSDAFPFCFFLISCRRSFNVDLAAKQTFIVLRQCANEKSVANKEKIPEAEESPKSVEESEEVKEQSYTSELCVNVVPKRAQSSHVKIRNSKMVKKMTKSAHMLGENQLRVAVETVSCFLT